MKLSFLGVNRPVQSQVLDLRGCIRSLLLQLEVGEIPCLPFSCHEGVWSVYRVTNYGQNVEARWTLFNFCKRPLRRLLTQSEDQ